MTAQLSPIPGLPLLPPSPPSEYRCWSSSTRHDRLLADSRQRFLRLCGPPLRRPLYARSNSGLLPTLPQMCRRFPLLSSVQSILSASLFSERALLLRLPCPALTRPPARCFPCALRELRGSAFPVPSTRNLPRNKRAAAALSGRDFLRLPSQKAPLALGSRAHSRRVAQGCPE
jgi:hypothetical protein